MNILNNLKIRDKLFSGFVSLLFFCCLIGFLGFKGMSDTRKRLDDMHNNLIPSLVMVGSIDNALQEYRRSYLRYMMENNPKNQKMLVNKMLESKEKVKKLIGQFEKLPLLPEERKLFTTIVSEIQDFYDITEQVRASFNSGRAYGELSAEHQQVKKLSDQLDIKIKQLLEFNAVEAKGHFIKSSSDYDHYRFWLLSFFFLSVILAITVMALITRSIVKPVQLVIDAMDKLKEGGIEKARIAEAIAAGDLNQNLAVLEPLRIEDHLLTEDEAGTLLKSVASMSDTQHTLDLAFARMAESLRYNNEQETLQDWFKNGQNSLNRILRGDKTMSELTEKALSFLAEYLGAGVGVLYLYDEEQAMLQITASYAFVRRKRLNDRIALGEGLAGQAARERKVICLSPAPVGYLPISSGIGEAQPVSIVALPLLHNNALVGVLEIGSFRLFSDNDLTFLEQSREAVAIALSVNSSRQRVNILLEQTQAQAEELQVQQEELQQTNEELEERAEMLEHQREEIRAKNRAVEEASQELKEKADELERVSTYKSEFLANMSHELRTPLNSMMILSSLLKDNREGTLTPKQVEFAATINTAGRDLLNLINDILDLSKIESGHLELHYEKFTINEISEQLEALFHPVGSEKGIEVKFSTEKSAPDSFVTDGQRTMQILKNLLSNACKFTSQGSVTLHTYRPDSRENPLGSEAVAFSVTDTGIGIPQEKQSLIFSAFQQADGSTSRNYGGTGLGLSISRQLARSMGGEILLASEKGKGSVFTLYLPLVQSAQASEAITSIIPAASKKPANVMETITPRPKTSDPLPSPIPDDRDLLPDDARTILIIEDDLTFAGILAEMVRARNFSALIAADGENGIAMAERYQPNAIILDVMLPHIDGWGVMRSLKDNPGTRHIPVHFITCLEERQKAMSMGAVGYATKPVSSDQLDQVFAELEKAISKTTKRLLIVEDDSAQVEAMIALLDARNVSISVANSGSAAISQIKNESFDCVVLDLGLSDMGAFEMLEELKKLDPHRSIPVIIHTGRELTHEDELRLHHYAESIIIKGAKSPERLLNEVTLFLHLVESSLEPGKQRMIRSSLDKEAMLAGKKVLIVDDDMRNIFSLSSALSEKDIVILEAENGREALERLDAFPDIDLVLMDIMMPEMDGYEAMRRIRNDPRFFNLPVIALTAKVMKGDREECLKAGASDYIPKPVDMEKLFSLLRVWLYSAS